MVRPELQYQFGIASLRNNSPNKVRLYCASVPRFRNHLVVFGTSLRVMVVALEEDKKVSLLFNCYILVIFIIKESRC